ncbi:MAG: adenylosuccinate lyase [Halobacteriota archaeon]
MTDPLEAVSPVDGRYAAITRPLRPFVSEAALIRGRLRVEVEYLIALADLAPIDLAFDAATRERLRELYHEFELDDARAVKRIETEGDDRRPATNHDVKAVEYWLCDGLEDLGLEEAIPWVHFGLTSEDVNNLAYRLLLRDAITEVLEPDLKAIVDRLRTDAVQHRSVAMLARTHGQPASPTTYGKELAVFAARLERGLDGVRRAMGELTGKFGGATGTFAAHHTAEPAVDWPDFAASFVEGFDLDYQPLTTQINPGDDLATLFDAIARVNTVLLDLDRDCWRYISDGYLVQRSEAGEVGSSTMPHKVNPIDFENSEGNLAKARADLRFLADRLPESRLQRDLSDSTVKRTIGASLAHCRIGYVKAVAGLERVRPDPATMEAELEASPAVLAEAIQTALRRVGDPEAYERLKVATRGVEVDESAFDELVDRVRSADPALAERLERLSPATYTGLADALVDHIDPA